MSKIYSFKIEDEQLKAVRNKTDNVSEFIRQALNEKLGIIEDINETFLKLEKMDKERNELNDKVNNYIEEKINQEKQITIAEKEKLENIEKTKKENDKQFFDKWFPILEEIDEIKNFQYTENWNSIKNLIPIVEIIFKKNIKGVGYCELRRYFYLRQNQILI